MKYQAGASEALCNRYSSARRGRGHRQAAPGVSNIESGEDGFTMTEASRILQGLRGADVIGADVVCLMPTKDSPNGITAMNATALMFELVSLIADRLSGGSPTALSTPA